ncbi:LPS assembly lipoprotein LptE [Histidinibacterium aquaticum]|uniref:LPS-assembly lipoprotein n=1 Tax=Histidinibacterium aquaticum TaxID=2613962 RepID=A0A5J5GD85_9RHOB|nr:LPS assembly lipoprotein LptE [Histidinibacterium aquaticum]KAA9005987.1 hypothetical protein F3S47_15645 [Histidinibacterium aquaticum]
MWSSDRLPRRAVLLGGLTLLAGCGFSPVYGPGGAAAPLLGTTAVEAPATEAGYRLRLRLIDRLGPSEAPTYLLSVDLDIRDAAVGVTSEQETTRYNLPGAATYRLTDVATGIGVASGTVDGFTSYSATGTSVSTFAAAEDARQRLAVVLADRILDRLAAALT